MKAMLVNKGSMFVNMKAMFINKGSMFVNIEPLQVAIKAGQISLNAVSFDFRMIQANRKVR